MTRYMNNDSEFKILVVDDVQPMRRIIKALLHNIGYMMIWEASNGHTAWEILKSQDIDLVITDWNMPKMSGLELLQSIRKDSSTKINNIPVLMVTAESTQDNVIDAVNSGVNHYIVKPFDAKTLHNKLAHIINYRRPEYNHVRNPANHY